MIPKKILVFLFAVITAFTLQAQTIPELPVGEELETKDDCAEYESTMVESAKWLEETPLNKGLSIRKDINSFVILWLTLSPTVTVVLSSQLITIYGKNDQLLPIYMASYARHYIENDSAATKQGAIKAGLTSMMKVYGKGISITKSKEMERLMELSDEKLNVYITRKLM